MTENDITRLCNKPLLWTRHILQRLFQRNIRIDDVKAVLANGEIIEQYPTDYPYPSCLIKGYTKTGSPLHVVCGSNGEELWLITAYVPNLKDWMEDFKHRRKT